MRKDERWEAIKIDKDNDVASLSTSALAWKM